MCPVRSTRKLEGMACDVVRLGGLARRVERDDERRRVLRGTRPRARASLSRLIATHDQALAGVPLVHVRHPGERLPAGPAPRRPEVDLDDLAAKICERNGARRHGQGEQGGGRRPGRLMPGEQGCRGDRKEQRDQSQRTAPMPAQSFSLRVVIGPNRSDVRCSL